MGISSLLLKWFEKEGRELPWRGIGNPYEIWVSEIILQQTRIQQGTAYYHKFLEKFPDVFSLASSDISEVLKVWQGLGYYSRARNMHETAKKIAYEYNGEFPGSYTGILMLKGIGEYTAGAIASIAYDEKVPAIDGNVKRVISRLYCITDNIEKAATTKKIRNILLDLMPAKEPGNFNQALMDLGSMICKPLSPACDLCPLNQFCDANKLAKVNEIPVRYKKVKIRNRHFLYLIIQSDGMVLINRRSGKDIWEQLYEFPLIELEKEPADEDIYLHISRVFPGIAENLSINKISSLINHVLSHQKILTRFIHINTDAIPASLLKKYELIKASDIHQYPLPRLIEKYIQDEWSP